MDTDRRELASYRVIEPTLLPPVIPMEEKSEDDDVVYIGSSKLSLSDKGATIESEPKEVTKPESPAVDLDRLLVSIERGSAVHPAIDPPMSITPVSVAPSATVLGKRAREPSPELVVSDALFNEIGQVNKLFISPCLFLESPPAVFELTVADDLRFRVRLSFSAGYPIERPKVVAIEEFGNDPDLAELTRVVLSKMKDKKPCIERLVRGLVVTLSPKLGDVPWKYRVQQFKKPKQSKGWFPDMIELDHQMRELRAARLDYPPTPPTFKTSAGFNQAFISEGYARDLYLHQGKEVEGNERLEYLGDSVLNALIASSMMKMYQLNEGGMTKLHDILRSNALFSVFSRAYEFPDRLQRLDSMSLNFKVEADVFEAVVGGLHQDGMMEDRGWITLQKWFDELIEPWLDWSMSRLDPSLKDRFLTWNHMPLAQLSRSPMSLSLITPDNKLTSAMFPAEPPATTSPRLNRVQRRILKPKAPKNIKAQASKGQSSRSQVSARQNLQLDHRPRREIEPYRLDQQPRQLERYAEGPPRAIGNWRQPPPMALEAAQKPEAGCEQRRWERILSLARYEDHMNFPESEIKDYSRILTETSTTRDSMELIDIRSDYEQATGPSVSLPGPHLLLSGAAPPLYGLPHEPRSLVSYSDLDANRYGAVLHPGNSPLEAIGARFPLPPRPD